MYALGNDPYIVFAVRFADRSVCYIPAVIVLLNRRYGIIILTDTHCHSGCNVIPVIIAYHDRRLTVFDIRNTVSQCFECSCRTPYDQTSKQNDDCRKQQFCYANRFADAYARVWSGRLSIQ